MSEEKCVMCEKGIDVDVFDAYEYGLEGDYWCEHCADIAVAERTIDS